MEYTASVGWDMGTNPETTYTYWENFWARKINEEIFSDPDTYLTATDDINAVKDIVNQLLIETNIFLKGESVQSGGFVIQRPTFPQFSKSHLKTLKRMKNKKRTLDAVDFPTVYGHYGGW